MEWTSASSRRPCTSSAWHCISRTASPATHQSSKRLASDCCGTDTDPAWVLQERWRNTGFQYWPHTALPVGVLRTCADEGLERRCRLFLAMVGDWVEEHNVQSSWAKRFWLGRCRSRCLDCSVAVTEAARCTCRDYGVGVRKIRFEAYVNNNINRQKD